MNEPRFTLHPVTTAARLRRLGHTMANCLANYTDRMNGRHRIVEVRHHGETRYAVHLRDGRIVTFEAAGNRAPVPAHVPIVRALLERDGHLAATARAASAVDGGNQDGRQRAATLPPAGSRRRPTPGPSAEPRRAHPVPRPAGISLQQLAADHLGPVTLRSPDWTEVAAALWCAGWLARLPGPDETGFERVVRDLAGRIATGHDPPLPPGPGPSAAVRAETRQRLLTAAGPGDWQLRRIAAVLAQPLRP